MDRKERRMKDARKAGLVIGSAGAIFGSILWIVILGAVLKSVITVTIPIALGIICFFAVVILADRYPERYLSILGVMILLVSEINFVFANLLFERIPNEVCGISTGKECFTAVHINIFIAIFFIAGLALILTDALRRAKR